MPELFRADVLAADAVAAAGCYPTAAALALAPLVQAGVIEPEGVIVDAASGVSGAGRTLKHSTHFGTANEDFTAYGLLDHRHTPEIEQASGASVLFTPHLAPMTRGILATCYARPRGATATATLLELLRTRYDGEPFVVVADEPPSTKATWGSNSAHLTARYDERTGWVIVLCALDNLVKGASGQALQCANLLLGLRRDRRPHRGRGVPVTPARSLHENGCQSDRDRSETSGVLHERHAAPGFVAAGVHCGIKAVGRARPRAGGDGGRPHR